MTKNPEIKTGIDPDWGPYVTLDFHVTIHEAEITNGMEYVSKLKSMRAADVVSAHIKENWAFLSGKVVSVRAGKAGGKHDQEP